MSRGTRAKLAVAVGLLGVCGLAAIPGAGASDRCKRCSLAANTGVPNPDTIRIAASKTCVQRNEPFRVLFWPDGNHGHAIPATWPSGVVTQNFADQIEIPGQNPAYHGKPFQPATDKPSVALYRGKGRQYRDSDFAVYLDLFMQDLISPDMATGDSSNPQVTHVESGLARDATNRKICRQEPPGGPVHRGIRDRRSATKATALKCLLPRSYKDAYGPPGHKYPQYKNVGFVGGARGGFAVHYGYRLIMYARYYPLAPPKVWWDSNLCKRIPVP